MCVRWVPSAARWSLQPHTHVASPTAAERATTPGGREVTPSLHLDSTSSWLPNTFFIQQVSLATDGPNTYMHPPCNLIKLIFSAMNKKIDK